MKPRNEVYDAIQYALIMHINKFGLKYDGVIALDEKFANRLSNPTWVSGLKVIKLSNEELLAKKNLLGDNANRETIEFNNMVDFRDEVMKKVFNRIIPENFRPTNGRAYIEEDNVYVYVVNREVVLVTSVKANVIKQSDIATWNLILGEKYCVDCVYTFEMDRKFIENKTKVYIPNKKYEKQTINSYKFNIKD